MVKYKLIKKYPGSPELGTIVEGKFLGHYHDVSKKSTSITSNFVENQSEYWQEIKELTLLEEAKLRYPIGTKFKSVQYDSGIKISNNNIYEETYMHLPIIYCDGTTIYYNNKWAEIIDDFVLPEKWCIKQNISKEVCDWFNKNGTTFANIHGSWTYLNYPYIDGYYSSEIKPGYTEITFEQFKKYVLKEETTVNVEEKVVEKDYEILSFTDLYSNKIMKKHQNGNFGIIWGEYTEKDQLDKITEGKQIHSVKRLSDGEI